jgi:hypothetical protein
LRVALGDSPRCWRAAASLSSSRPRKSGGFPFAAGGDGLLGVPSCELVVAGDECHLGEDELDGGYDGRRQGGDAPREGVELLGDRRGGPLVAENVGGLGERGHVGEPQLVAANVSVFVAREGGEDRSCVLELAGEGVGGGEDRLV